MTVATGQVHGLRMRLAQLDQNGVPTVGADQLYVSKSYSRVRLSPVYTDGAEIDQKNASGETAVNYKADDTFKRIDIEIQLVTVDPYIMAMLSGGSVLTDGDKVGAQAPALGAVTGDGMSLEVWSRRVENGEEDVEYPWGWWVYPRMRNLRQGQWTHEDGAVLPMFTGQAYENPNWSDGPLNDWLVDSTKVWQYMPTAELPVAQTGYYAIAAS